MYLSTAAGNIKVGHFWYQISWRNRPKRHPYQKFSGLQTARAENCCCCCSVISYACFSYFLEFAQFLRLQRTVQWTFFSLSFHSRSVNSQRFKSGSCGCKAAIMVATLSSLFLLFRSSNHLTPTNTAHTKHSKLFTISTSFSRFRGHFRGCQWRSCCRLDEASWYNRSR